MPKILIVEDEPLIVSSLTIKLQNEGYEICGDTDSGEGAIAKARSLCPDLILMDVSLKGKPDGISAALKIQQSSDIPIVYLTAYSDNRTLERIKNTRHYGYILKPYNTKALSITIDMALHRKQMEKELYESEQKYRMLFEYGPIMYFRLDTEGKVLSVNSYGAEHLGYTVDELEGNSVLMVFDEQSREEVKKKLDECLKEPCNVGVWEFQKVRKDGSRLWVREYIRAVEDGNGKKAVLVLCDDITKARETENALIESEDRFRIMADSAPVMIWMTDTDRLSSYFNEVWLEFRGRTIQQELGDGWTEGVHPDDYKNCLSIYKNQFDKKEEFSMEYRLKRHDGQFRWVYEHGVPRYLTDGSFAGYIGSCIDITDKKLVLEQIKSSEEKFKVLYDNNLSMYFAIGKNGDVISVNNYGAEQLGYTVDELIGSSVFSIFYEEDIDQLKEQVKLCLEDPGETRKWELRKVRKDGTVLWVREYARAVKNSNGEDIIMVLCIDISDLKNVQNALSESEQKYRLLIENTFELIIETDFEGNLVYASPNHEEILGYKSQEIVTTNFLSGIHPDDREAVRAEFNKCRNEFRGGKCIYRFEHKNGSWIWLESLGRPYRKVNGHKRIIISSRDVTEQKFTEQKIREQSEVIDKAKDAIIMTDLNLNISYWNKSAESVYGYSFTEVEGKNLDKIIFSEGSTTYHAVLHELYKIGSWSGIFNQIRRFGESVTIESRITLITNNETIPKSILIINSDITDKKVLEDQVLRYQRIESIGNLAGGIAHDLNNVLQPITLGLNLLKKEIADKKQLGIIDMIDKSAGRGSELIKQIMLFAKGIDIEKTNINLREFIFDIKKLLSETFPRTIDIKIKIEEDVKDIIGDYTQIDQVLMNLCVNARDAMQDGGILEISCENIKLDENTEHKKWDLGPGDYVKIKVLDTGRGISADKIDKVFDPFYTDKSGGNGTGLGLSIAYGIIKKHGGHINVTSELNKGTQFELCLPATEKEDVYLDIRKSSELVTGRGQTVLIVDDETAIVETLEMLLLDNDYKVLTASDGQEGLEIFKDNLEEIKLIIVDIMMPVMDGMTLIPLIKDIDGDTKIITTSGLVEKEKLDELHNQDYDEFLSKPFDGEKLLSIISRLINS